MTSPTLRCSETPRFAAALAIAAAILWIAPTAVAEHHEAPAPEWDQAKVTELAEQLAEAADKLHRELSRQRTQSQVGSGQARSMMQFRDNIRVARNESRHLARQLADGRDHDETSPVYRRLMGLIRNARDTARRLFIKAPATEFIAQANAALDGLAPFYPDIRPST